MLRFLAVLLLGSASGAALAQTPAPATAPGQAPAQTSAPQAPPDSEPPGVDIGSLPAPPPGKSTILGGEIRKVDPVRDLITLRIFGQHPVKIYFDERTQVFLDGKRMPLHSLQPTDHASVQTVLDGTDVYALSIHMLSHMPEGDYQGRVLGYNPDTTELTVSSPLSGVSLKLLVPADVTIVRQGQPAFTAGQHGTSDLVRGSLISVKFQSNPAGQGVASKISVLATPGAEFAFIGNIVTLDTHHGELVLVDPRDDESYKISFDPRLTPAVNDLHVGNHITVKASFDGSRYMATEIVAN